MTGKQLLEVLQGMTEDELACDVMTEDVSIAGCFYHIQTVVPGLTWPTKDGMEHVMLLSMGSKEEVEERIDDMIATLKVQRDKVRQILDFTRPRRDGEQIH